MGGIVTDDAGDGRAMGCAQRLGAAAVDCCFGLRQYAQALLGEAIACAGWSASTACTARPASWLKSMT